MSENVQSAESVLLAAAWQAGFDSALPHLITAVNDAGNRGTKAAIADLKRVPNPYRTSPGSAADQ